MAEFLFKRFDIDPSLSTISRSLKATRWSKKAIKQIAAERNLELREDWKQRIPAYQPEQLCFLDESACSEKSTHARLGWSPYVVAPTTISKLHCRDRFSILPAYALDGYIAWEVIPGSYNTERFLEFVARLCYQC